MSFDFSPDIRASRSETIVPMINVVFLLLIFFLMSAQFTRARPDPAAPSFAAPMAEQADVAHGKLALTLGRDGVVWFEGQTGAQALADFTARVRNAGTPALILADGASDAAGLAALVQWLAVAGLTGAEIVVVRP